MMKRQTRPASCVFVIAAVMATAALGADDGAITPTETIRLFDGIDLSAFDTWLADHGRNDPDNVFSVVRGASGKPVIRLSGNGFGGLIMKQRYANYRLVVEYRWGEATWGDRKSKARGSGILLHDQGEPGNFSRDFTSPWMQSIEVQIIDGGVGDILLLAGWTRTGQSLPTF